MLLPQEFVSMGGIRTFAALCSNVSDVHGAAIGPLWSADRSGLKEGIADSSMTGSSTHMEQLFTKRRRKARRLAPRLGGVSASSVGQMSSFRLLLRTGVLLD